MKKPFIFPAVIVAIALFSCQKQQTEAEKNAEIDRKVQERLAAEHQAEQQQQLDQRQAEVDAREKALAEKENTAAATPARRQRSESESYEPRAREPREGGPARGYSTFYNRLDPYGDWIEAGDYGYVFHPREAESSRSWRPYTNGRWVYTDAGWTWISEEPFGWATYHYGRWTRLRGVGWVWVPGSQWAPAWVSWRKSNDYVGWAPLPPEARFDQRTGIHNWSDSYYDVGPDQYCFVASREFGAPRVEQTLLPPERNVTIINQTTNVTNITYNNTTVVNEGPNYDEMRTQSREPMQRLRLERNVSVDVNVEAPRPLVQGETVIVAAPVIAAPQASERPRAVRQNIAQVTVDLGWAAITNQEEAKKTRQKMKAEATPPPNAPSKKFVKTETITNSAAQSAEPSATSTSTVAAVAPPAAATTTPAAPEATATPQRAAAVATSTPLSPTPSQRRGKLLVPNATALPQTTPSPTPRTSAPTPPAEISLTPIPRTTPPATSRASQQEMPRGQFKSQTQTFNPRKAEPMASASPISTPEESRGGWTGKGFKVPNDSPSPGATSTSSQGSTSPAEKLSKPEKKELRRAEKQEMKRQRKEGIEMPSPSPAP